MQTLWFITNPHSGSATQAKCEAIEAVFSERGLILAGRTSFPDDEIPLGRDLDMAGIDTVVLFAGDGTINAVLCALEGWKGSFLILPGGTMNMLSKQLHESGDPAEIIHMAHTSSRRVALDYVETGRYRAFVGVILGPVGNWAKAREAVRAFKIGRLAQAVRHAWQRTFSESVRIAGAPRLRRGYQAVFISPSGDSIEIAAIRADDWRSIADLGWGWISGDWLAAQAVTRTSARNVRILGPRRALALFDGEPQMLEPGTVISGTRSAPRFLSTLEESA